MTRWRIVDGLAEMKTVWSGLMDEIDFLGRLYDLDAMPSDDPRFDTAGRDIAQHRILNPLDWPYDWIFSDPRFGLTDNDEFLLRFLAEMLHPAVRTDLAEVESLHGFLSAVLVHDGYEIVQAGDISGAQCSPAQRIGSGVRGSIKNLIFAAIGHKPEIVLDDALNNDLRIVNTNSTAWSTTGRSLRTA